MTTSPQLRGRFKAKPELDELLAEALGARHRSTVATRLDVTYECARLWLTGARTVTPDVATRLARIAGKPRAELFTEADKCPSAGELAAQQEGGSQPRQQQRTQQQAPANNGDPGPQYDYDGMDEPF